jgi:hypothetical protein
VENRGDQMSLQEALQKFKEGVLSQVSAADAAVMAQATEELVRSGIREKALKRGEAAPDFILPNTSGEMVKLSDLLAKGPVVVTFYRGAW